MTDDRFKVRPRIVISGCLLGWSCRYDGNRKSVPQLFNWLTQWAHLLPICPETACGLGIPREPIRFRGPERRLRTVWTDRDVTERLWNWSRMYLETLRGIHPAGFVVKARSPSCGVGDAEWERLPGHVDHCLPGVFVCAVRSVFPGVPIVDEEHLELSWVREQFRAGVCRQ